MPRVVYTRQGAGRTSAPRQGDLVEVTSEQAKRMISEGDARPVRGEEPETPESNSESGETEQATEQTPEESTDEKSDETSEEKSEPADEKTSTKSSKQQKSSSKSSK